MNPPTVLFFLKYRRSEFLAAIRFLEALELVEFLDQSLAARLGFLFLPSEVDVVNQVVVSAIATDAIVLAAPELDRAERRKILRVLRNLDQVFGLRALRNRDLCAPATCAEYLPATPRACLE